MDKHEIYIRKLRSATGIEDILWLLRNQYNNSDIMGLQMQIDDIETEVAQLKEQIEKLTGIVKNIL